MPVKDEFPLFLVEDSDDDLFLFRRLLTKAEVRNPLMIATNGQAAIDQLARLAPDGPADGIPALMFLDLKLPLRSGFEVLQWVRSEPRFTQTAVIVLSSSAEARDVKRAYDLGAQSYLVKYPGPQVFREVIDTVGHRPPDVPLACLRFPGVPRP
ncbi:MAG TPA: response regulator [Opitutaceae bacterium]|nr:response regulator [Opitutaceae bacterium]